MRTLAFNETLSTSGGSFTEMGAYVGTGLWTKVTVVYVAKTLLVTGALPVLSPYAAIGGLIVYAGAGTAIGAVVDKAAMKVRYSVYTLFSNE